MPVPATKEPLLVKSPATRRVAGEFNVPVMVMLLKVVVPGPVNVVVPLNVTLLEAKPLLKVPVLLQFPETLMDVGAVKVPVILTLLKLCELLPEIVVVPPKVTVAVPAFKVPLLIRFPLTLKLAEGVSVPVMVIPPKTGGVAPEITVVPENIMLLPVSTDDALLTRLPLISKSLLPELKVPFEKVRIPFTVMSLFRLSVPEPSLVKLANAVVLDGNSGPVDIGEVLL